MKLFLKLFFRATVAALLIGGAYIAAAIESTIWVGEKTYIPLGVLTGVMFILVPICAICAMNATRANKGIEA